MGGHVDGQLVCHLSKTARRGAAERPLSCCPAATFGPKHSFVRPFDRLRANGRGRATTGLPLRARALPFDRLRANGRGRATTRVAPTRSRPALRQAQGERSGAGNHKGCPYVLARCPSTGSGRTGTCYARASRGRRSRTFATSSMWRTRSISCSVASVAKHRRY